MQPPKEQLPSNDVSREDANYESQSLEERLSI
jgi:hypothetical protein